MTEAAEETGTLALPVGTVTLLLADIEGSTRLWETRADEMASAIARLDDVVNEVVGVHRGVRPIEQGEGDSFVAAFARASDAVACALALQRADLGPLRLRIGVHSGEVELRDAGNYIGSTVNRCARIRNLGHGGQVLVSSATVDLVADATPNDASFRDLGVHRLRDLSRPERLFQLCHPELAGAFPALKSLDAHAHNLPVRLNSFIGREAELAAVGAMLEAERCLTLTGSGGSGKTRLALQVAGERVGDYAAGVWFVDLASIEDPDFVPSAVATAVGLAGPSSVPATQRIVAHFGDDTALLLLDNCEHVTAAAAALAEEVLRGCPAVRILATSREPLGIAAEVTWRVPSLTLPPDDEPAGLTGLARSEAIELFATRARQVRPTFEVTEANAASVTQLCRRLDGIPLAIELAAARVRVLSPEQILTGLGDAFRLLTGGARTAVPRHQTLRASIEWSHGLLSESERAVLRRISVFPGSFDLPASEAVAVGTGIEPHHVLDQLTLLVDKSLVVTEEGEDVVRYRLLETVRQFATEELAHAGEDESARQRHCEYYASFCVAATSVIGGRAQDDALARLDAEKHNARAAFAWASQANDHHRLADIAWSLKMLWNRRGFDLAYLDWFVAGLDRALANAADAVARARLLLPRADMESFAFRAGGVDFAGEAVELARAATDERLLALALMVYGYAQHMSGRARPEDVLDEAVALARQIGDKVVETGNLSILAEARVYRGRLKDAREAASAALALARELNDSHLIGGALLKLGQTMAMQGELDEGLAILQQLATDAAAQDERNWQGLALGEAAVVLAVVGDHAAADEAAQRCAEVFVAWPAFGAFGVYAQALVCLARGDTEGAAALLSQLGDQPQMVLYVCNLWPEVELARGDVAAAGRWTDLAVGLMRDLDAPWHLGRALMAQARVVAHAGRLGAAEGLAHEALTIWEATDTRHFPADTLELLAEIAAGNESYAEAVRLLAAADAIRQATGYVRWWWLGDAYDACREAARTALGEDAYSQAWDEGAALSATDAIAYARRGRGERGRPTIGWQSLTPTEQRVVALVAEGLPNKEIATRLFVSHHTVRTHLSHIFGKLGVRSRTELAKLAHEER